LAAIALAAFALIAVPSSWGRDLASGGLLVAAIVVAATACYRTWTVGIDRERVVRLISKLADGRRLAAAEQFIWTALVRGDVETVQCGLRLFPLGTDDWAGLMSWLMGNRGFQDRTWLKMEILSSVLHDGLDQKGARAVHELLKDLLSDSLDQDDIGVAEEIVVKVMSALRRAAPFTQDHGQVMCDLARAIWLIGDYRGEAPRNAHVAGQLDYLKSIYEVRRKDLWRTLLERNDIEGIDHFVAFLCITVQDTGAVDAAFSLVFDIIADGVPRGVLTSESVFELANMVGFVRRGAITVVDDQTLSTDMWDGIIADLAYALVAIATPDDDIQRMLTNAGHALLDNPAVVSPGLGELDEAVLVRLDRLLGKQPRYKAARTGEIAARRPPRRRPRPSPTGPARHKGDLRSPH
jgi:hypothetical protein